MHVVLPPVDGNFSAGEAQIDSGGVIHILIEPSSEPEKKIDLQISSSPRQAVIVVIG